MAYPGEAAIPTPTCWELLRDGWMGRLALTVDALPAILPVEYCVTGEELALCLGQYRLPARSLNNAVVGFAVDSIDPPGHTGWTIHVYGLTRLPEPQTGATRCQHDEHGQIAYLNPDLISGHRLALCPLGTGLPRPALP